MQDRNFWCASMIARYPYWHWSNGTVTDRMVFKSHSQSVVVSWCLNSGMDSSFTFIASVHCPKATAQMAARFCSRVKERDTNCLICSLKMNSLVLSHGSGGAVGRSTLGVLGSRKNREAKSVGYLYLGCVLFESLDGLGVLPLVCLFIKTAKNMSVHPFSVPFEGVLSGRSRHIGSRCTACSSPGRPTVPTAVPVPTDSV